MADHKRPESMERITTPALAEQFIAEQVAAVRAQVGDKKVLLALSGGVDSSVVAALLIKAVGKQLTCVHVNHGLLRKGEPEQVVEVFRNQMDANLVYVDAVDRFLDKLAGVADPETKRKIIGAEFIRVFEEEARKLEGKVWQYFTVVPDFKSTGVRDNARTFDWPVILRAVNTVDAMTATVEDVPFPLLQEITARITSEVKGVNRVLFDLTPKPSGTIEWE